MLNIDGKRQAHAEAVVAKSTRTSVLDSLKRPAMPRSTDKKPKQHEEVRYTPYSAFQDILNHYNADKAEVDKLPMIPFHGLRHTKATLQIAAGTDVRTVSAILGHRETSTAMNIYSHSLQTAEQEAAANMERLLAKQA